MDAIDVSYTVSGEGPPLYMVHGIGSRRVTWDGLLPGLEDHFTCIRYDLRGHGESPVPPVPYSLDDLVDDLEALRMRLDHDRIHVIGIRWVARSDRPTPEPIRSTRPASSSCPRQRVAPLKTVPRSRAWG